MKVEIIEGDTVQQERFRRLMATEMPEVEITDKASRANANNKGDYYRQRLIVRLGDKIYIVWMNDIAYFISREKTTYLVTYEGKQYIVDQSLDMLEHWLRQDQFFRINRATIIHIRSVKMATRHFSSRLKLQLEPHTEDDMFVSRVRTNDFMRWINK